MKNKVIEEEKESWHFWKAGCQILFVDSPLMVLGILSEFTYPDIQNDIFPIHRSIRFAHYFALNWLITI